MIELKFDTKGNPLPHTLIFLDINEIEFNFVNSISSSSTRKAIFDGYKEYCKDITAVIKFEIEQWIDGSFVTKKVNPNDIDLVNCVPVSLLDVLKDALNPFLTGKGVPKKMYCVDGYLLPICEQNDERYQYCLEWHDYWMKWFGRDRDGNTKGIIKTKVVPK